MKKILTNFFISFLAVIIVFLVVEVGFRLFLGKISGKVIPLSLEIHEKVDNKLLRYDLIPNSSVFQDNVEYKINSVGIRDYHDHTLRKSKMFRIAAVGDSFTFGLGVKLKYTWPKQLEKILEKNHKTLNYDVFNFGVMGYDLTQNIEVIKVKVLKFKPDLIVIGYCVNDVGLFSREFTEINYFKGYQNFMKTGIKFIDIILEHSRFFQFIKNRIYLKKTNKSFKKIEKPRDAILAIKKGYHNYLEELYSQPEVQKKLKEKFGLLGEISKKNRIPILVVLFPELIDFEKNIFFEAKRIVKEFSETSGIFTLDLSFCFRNYKEDQLRLNKANLHPNPFGYKLTSKCIFNYLLKSKLIKN